MAAVDIVICGTGSFAARILFDLAATAPRPVSVAVVGRNRDRLAWLRTAANARAALFGSGARVAEYCLPDLTTESVGPLLAELRPSVVANTASVQGGRVAIDRPDAWTRLVQEAGLACTALLQARISHDIARAVAQLAPTATFVNCCYPDVVNPMLKGAGLPIACGIGNVAILAHAFAGLLGPGHPRLHLLAQHAALSAFRRPAAQRSGVAPLRLWIDGIEIGDVFERFAAVKLAPEPVIDVSGASGVPLFLALAAGAEWSGHVPGPNGLTGGYPVRLVGRRISLDLPPGVTEEEAIAWNRRFEAENGIIVGSDGVVRYVGRVEAALRAVSPDLAAGFSMSSFDAAYSAMAAVRARLLAAA
ncbi:hypothetical protein [Falsiroseomonas oryzae]|uniref:hypothetical protein n=1 Tax=Falsiroseomonas oryzae TaxID=2766473 RepID=UPI0022EA8F54|nr:hypothetical protein [Roseomonas sp. MO-31]